MGGLCSRKEQADDVRVVSRDSDGFTRGARGATESMDATITSLAPADGKVELNMISPRELRDDHGIVPEGERSSPNLDTRGSVAKRGSYLETQEWLQDVLDDTQKDTKAQLGQYAKKVSSEL